MWKAEAASMVRQWDSKAMHYDGVRIECFNKEEADALKAEFQRLRPGVPVYTSWYTFGDNNVRS
jgi:hypothetical protein